MIIYLSKEAISSIFVLWKLTAPQCDKKIVLKWVLEEIILFTNNNN